MSVWKGRVLNVVWPRTANTIDLDVELWTESHESIEMFQAFQSLSFEGFISLDSVPLWTVSSSEFTVMCNEEKSREFWTQFSMLPQIVALKARIPDNPESFLLIYPAPDKEDNTVQIKARTVDLSISFDLPESSNSPEPETPERSSNVPNVKAAISQTVMSALRLRGIRKTNPDFKKIYYAMHSLVDISLRRMDQNKISIITISEKVEQLWSVVENTPHSGS